jgi:RNA polymerase sigma factor (sigma-70 family)
MHTHTDSAAPPIALTPEQFSLLLRVIRSVARAHRLGPDDAEDFGQTVHLKLLERGYEVFRSFEGRSSLSTYLHVVVTRLLLDWRNTTRGKWRPSAAAVRLGPEAVALERLTHRDGLTRGEAVALLASRQPARVAATERGLDTLAAALPARPRKTFVPETVVEAHESRMWVDFDDPVAADDARRRVRALRHRLRRACAELPPDDRRLIGLRYGRALTVQAIGQQLGTDPKPLYRRLERSLSRLRRSMTGAPDSRFTAAVRGSGSLYLSGEHQP